MPTAPMIPSAPKNPAKSVCALSAPHHSRVAILPNAYSAPARIGNKAAIDAPPSASGPKTRMTPTKPKATAITCTGPIAWP